MRTALARNPAARAPGLVAAAAIFALGMGRLTVTQPGLALAAAVVVVAMAVAVTGTAPLLLCAFPAVFVARRIGPGALNMSVADVVLVGSALAALPFVPWNSPIVRKVAGVMAAYLGILLVTVVAEPTARAGFEWAHRGALLFGGLAVGSAVGALGRVDRALRALFFASCAVAFVAVVQSVSTGLVAAFPFGLQKNFAGGLLAMVLIIAVVAPLAFELPPTTVQVGRMLMFVGILGTQSRGAMVSLVVALGLWTLTTEGRRGRVLLVPGALFLGLVIVVSLKSDNAGRRAAYTSSGSRAIANAAADKEWKKHPIFGAGIRYFKAPGYALNTPEFRNAVIEPHSVFYSTLAESGVVGLVALAALLGFSLRALRSEVGPLVAAAALVLVARVTHSVWDIFWIGGIQAVPWLLLGLVAGSSGEDDPSSVTGDAVSAAP